MRSKSEADLSDVFVWTNTRVIKWVNSIGRCFSKMALLISNLGLTDYSQNLKESGIHGSLIAMDGNFRAEDLALALKIPNNHPVNKSGINRPR